MTVVRAALVQSQWTGDKESMIKRARGATPGRPRPQGAQVICFQELFYGPYFCQVQDAAVLRVRRVGPGPDDRAVPGAGRRARHGDGAADVRGRSSRASTTTPPRSSTPTARYLGKYRKHHIPQVPRLLGEVLLPARQPRATRSSTPPSAGSASTSATTGTSPRAGATLGLNGAADRVQPVGHQAAACRPYLWQLEQPAAAVANEYFIGAINRVGIEPTSSADDDFYGSSYFVDPRGQLRRRGRRRQDQDELVVRDLDLDEITEVRNDWRSTATAGPTPTRPRTVDGAVMTHPDPGRHRRQPDRLGRRPTS